MNEKKFRDFADATAPALVAYAHSLCGDLHLAQDVVQECFLAYLKNFETIKSPKAWLYKTCKNRILDTFKKQKETQIPETLADSSEVPAAKLERDELHNRLRESMKLLKEAEAEIITLRYFGDLSYAEIAAVLGISAISAGVRLNRAHAALKKAMNQNGEL